jgi:carboxyl-terminal processing protease
LPPAPWSDARPRHGHFLRTVVTVLITVVIVGPLGFYLGALFEFNAGPQLNNSLAPLFFAKPVSGLDLPTLDQMWQIIQREYARKNPSAQAAFDGAGKGLVHSLDSQYGDGFSAYLTPDELQRNKEFLSGSFGGVGAAMAVDNGVLTISSVYPNTPADRAGLKAKDAVKRIDGVDTTNMAVDAAVARIRGKVGTHVRLVVQRGAATKEFDLIRDNIVIPSVRSIELRKGVLYVRVYDFGEHTADDFEKALKDGINRGDGKIILDLRQNPGGFVNAADAVTSEFVSSGLDVTLVDRNGKRDEHRVSGHGVAFTQQLVVLIDAQSASASEIVAGALKDNHRALALVGQKTFGKGSVQTDYSLRNGGDLHLTIALWYTPSGHSIEKTPTDPKSGGIAPDKEVALAKPDDLYQVDQAGADPKKDAQLQAALALLG